MFCINRFTSLCKNLFNLLEFLAEAFRYHVHHCARGIEELLLKTRVSWTSSHSEVNLLIPMIYQQYTSSNNKLHVIQSPCRLKYHGFPTRLIIVNIASELQDKTLKFSILWSIMIFFKKASKSYLQINLSSTWGLHNEDRKDRSKLAQYSNHVPFIQRPLHFLIRVSNFLFYPYFSNFPFHVVTRVSAINVLFTFPVKSIKWK